MPEGTGEEETLWSPENRNIKALDLSVEQKKKKKLRNELVFLRLPSQTNIFIQVIMTSSVSLIDLQLVSLLFLPSLLPPVPLLLLSQFFKQ